MRHAQDAIDPRYTIASAAVAVRSPRVGIAKVTLMPARPEWPSASPPVAASDRPLLGVAGSWGAAEIELHRRFDELHQLLYRRGGLASSNAAVDELAKLLLVRLWAERTGAVVTDHRAAFAAALRDPSLMARDPAGHAHPVWPLDEPFRLTQPDVLAAADQIAAAIVTQASALDATGAGRGIDALGTAFDALLAGRYDHAGGLGSYLTPSGVARMMADLAVPLVTADLPAGAGAGSDGSIPAPGFGDPYCGTGRFLVALLAALPPDHPLRIAGPFGADVSASAVAKARVNLLLYGVRHPLVWTVRDSVTDSTVDSLVGRVPLILTNPPFGEGQYDSAEGIARTAAVAPAIENRTRIDPSLAGLARALTLLAPGGVLGIVLPDGVLRSAPVQSLLADPSSGVEPLAVVSLPPVTFALSGTVARTSAVFLRRTGVVRTGVVRTGVVRKDALLTSGAQQGRLPDTKRVVLARVGHVGYVTRAGKPAPDPAGDELPAVARLVHSSLDTAAGGAPAVVSESPLVAVVDRDELRTLDPARLDPAAVAARRSLIDAGGVRLAEYLTAVTPRRCRSVTSPFVSVLHIDDLGTVDWHAARRYTPVTAGVLAEPGELIVSLLNPAQLRAAVMPPGEPVQVSAEFGVFRSTVDPYAVLALLYSPAVRAQLRPLGTGTSSSRRRISPDDVLGLVVPKLEPSTLDRIAATVRAAHQQITAARATLRDAYDRH
ncbi:MAG: N-6 DNA methylase [Micromonosporaceae bacterium]|nr:N-6 DNA methylase [Micromonosporaceae bacterium]